MSTQRAQILWAPKLHPRAGQPLATIEDKSQKVQPKLHGLRGATNL